jgi:hypothetical protein
VNRDSSNGEQEAQNLNQDTLTSRVADFQRLSGDSRIFLAS